MQVLLKTRKDNGKQMVSQFYCGGGIEMIKFSDSFHFCHSSYIF